MGLSAGTKLGPYEILGALGAGGMGEVYRARDTRLERTVAIKVLNSALVASPDVKARFEREARAISQLNHPNICTLHDIGCASPTVAGGPPALPPVDFLVMEFIDGESLTDRLRRGPLPMPELLKIGSEIADALDRAHRAGIVHRDLKPGNIMLAKSGCKLLDFGLAKPMVMAAGANPAGQGAAPLLSAAVTVSGPSPQMSPLTTQGAIIGTIQYMSPEQIEGKEADARSDIFALGAVLYEMATGKRAFEGKSQLSTATAILEKEPEPLTASQPTTPAALDHTICTCLVKDREMRRQSARDVLLDLQWIAKEGALLRAGSSAADRPNLRWMTVAVAAALLVAVVVWRVGRPAAFAAPVMRFTIAVPAGASLGGSWYQSPGIALSRDGSQLAFVAHSGGSSQIYLRSMSDVIARPVPGTEGATTPFFSPDGRWLGFDSAGKLKKVPTSGGAAVVIGSPTQQVEAGLYGAYWNSDDFIFFSDGSGIYRIAAGGGTPEAVTRLDQQNAEVEHGFPHVLPGGKALLFVVRTGKEASFDEADVWAVALANGKRKLLIKAATDPHYVASGHLIFLRAGVLFAVPFDADKLEVRGEAAPVVENVRENPRVGAGQFGIADNGTLVYVSGGVSFGEHELVMVDKSGKGRALTAVPRPYEDFSISPDGRYIATTIEGSVTDTWVHDIARDTDSRFTFGVEHRDPCWTPDGKRITYSGFKDGKYGLFWRAADGSGPEEELAATPTNSFPWFWSPDGKTLLYSSVGPAGDWDISAFSLPDRKIRPVLNTPFSDDWAAFSPDGKWIAYDTNESGQYEVYVAPFPALSPRTRISIDGGLHPLWSPDGRELYYRTGSSLEALAARTLSVSSKVEAVSVQTAPALKAGTPHELFEGPYFNSGHDWAITPDGRDFIFIRDKEGQSGPGEMSVVLNWFEDVKRRAPQNEPGAR